MKDKCPSCGQSINKYVIFRKPLKNVDGRIYNDSKETTGVLIGWADEFNTAIVSSTISGEIFRVDTANVRML